MIAHGPSAISKPVLEGVSKAIDQLERAWLPAILFGDPEMHAYETLPMDWFARMLDIAMAATTGRRYLEVGCGIGTKLVVAQWAGLEVHAIEARAQYAAAAQFMCPEAKVEIADARKYDGYGGFDIIYCYRPLIPDEAQIMLEDYMVARMKQDAVLMMPLRDAGRLGWSEVQPFSSVWSR
jgi:2-polyprenyl-3-methyl-5-hydroxy-6-metoxy-1,4-benzoquinol methylase